MLLWLTELWTVVVTNALLVLEKSVTVSTNKIQKPTAAVRGTDLTPFSAGAVVHSRTAYGHLTL